MPSAKTKAAPLAPCTAQLPRVLLGLCLSAGVASACGPFFPNYLLDRGDLAVLTAPEAGFRAELERMKLIATVHRSVPGANQPRQTLAIELADLRAALDPATATTSEEREAIVSRHRAEREKISVFAPSGTEGTSGRAVGLGMEPAFALRPDSTNNLRILGAWPQIVPGLPGEFAEYFRGSIAWHQGDLAGARRAWTALLARPPAERRFKSTWAAFMLGKSWEADGRAQAARYFQKVRQFATNGFADSLGLAASSLGWEARGWLQDRQYAKAIDLYLAQAASGDPTAVLSLRWAAAAALVHGRSQHRALAQHPRAQRVITAYLISGGRDPKVDVDNTFKEAGLRLWGKASTWVPTIPAPQSAWHQYESTPDLWLQALEDAEVKDVDSTEQIALAAYQAGQWQTAQRWLQRARSTPATQWLQAKLWLREGKVDEAAALLATVCRAFPTDAADPHAPPAARLMDNLHIDAGDFSTASAAEQARGELGVFLLARRQFTEALDTLLHSAPAYWMDAAYVAERVLTLDELKKYVDQHWPPEAGRAEPPSGEAEGETAEIEHTAPQQRADTPGEHIRYLLARRLARAHRRTEARAYFPSEWLPRFDTLCDALHDAETPARPVTESAEAFLEAAEVTRRLGLELIGTEVEPDFRIHDGNFQDGVTIAARAGLRGTNHLAASAEEIERATRHGARPEERWHYRSVAAGLAARGARLLLDAEMPASPPSERARVLFEAAQTAHQCGADWAATEVGPSEKDTVVRPAASPAERLLAPYAAAALAWKAAQWLPNNSDETARVLCLGGSWIKACNPQAADLFYKALVRRCRKTAIGAEADRLRWFPLLDGKGNLRPRSEQPLSPAERAARSRAENTAGSATNSSENGTYPATAENAPF